MTEAQAQLVLRASAIVSLLAGLFLLAGTWDGLWDALDLPQGKPALFVQIGGAAVLGLAFLLWRAAEEPRLRATVATAAAGADGLAALIVLVWLVSGRVPDDVGGLGTVLLILVVVVLGALALLQARVAVAEPGGERS